MLMIELAMYEPLAGGGLVCCGVARGALGYIAMHSGVRAVHVLRWGTREFPLRMFLPTIYIYIVTCMFNYFGKIQVDENELFFSILKTRKFTPNKELINLIFLSGYDLIVYLR